MCENMHREASLRFVEHSVDSYLVVIMHLYSQNQRTFLIRPCNPETKTLMDAACSLFGDDIQFFRDAKETPNVAWEDLPVCIDYNNIDSVLLVESNEKTLSSLLMSYLNNPCQIVASISKDYFKNRGLFITTIPKSGTHILHALISCFGYEHGGEYIESVIPGRWYYLGNKLGPHCDFKEFYTYLRYQPRGGIFHPFFGTPAIFLYRNPLDIAVSEAHYITKANNNPWAHYYRDFSKLEVLAEMLSGNGINLSIRERMMVFSFWLRLSNVIPISYEEIIGSEGGGSSEEQLKTVWSLQLKLHIPGKPQDFAKKIYDTKSRTFRRGKTQSYLSEFTEIHFHCLKKLPKDFMEIFGYCLNPEPNNIIPRRVDEFRQRSLMMPKELDDMLFSPEMIENFLSYNIISCGRNYYAIPQSLGEIDISRAIVEHDDRIIVSGKIEEVKRKISKAVGELGV